MNHESLITNHASIMINRIIEFSLRNRFIIVAAYVLLAGWGYWALTRTPVDAIPDLSENQVIVFSDWTGRSPQEVEDQVTYPLTAALQGLPGVRTVRGQSAFGFSMINVIFEDSVDLYWARTRVLERLNLVTRQLQRGCANARPGRDRSRADLLVHGRRRWLRLARSAHASRLVHSLSTQLGARSRGSRLGRRLRSAVSNRRRSESASRLQHSVLGGRRGRASQQRERRR